MINKENELLIRVITKPVVIALMCGFYPIRRVIFLCTLSCSVNEACRTSFFLRNMSLGLKFKSSPLSSNGKSAAFESCVLAGWFGLESAFTSVGSLSDGENSTSCTAAMFWTDD